MNILMISQEYPADDLEKEFTPVVHFFTKEWVAMGHEVRVINCPSNFPALYYTFAKPFRRRLESRWGLNIRMYRATKRIYDLDGVPVIRIPLCKYRPHGKFSKHEIKRSIKETIAFCNETDFTPDIIVGHWSNPAVEMMIGLKKQYNVKTALVMHDDGPDFRSIFKKECRDYIDSINIWGFRSPTIQRDFESYYGKMRNTFICYSGVPASFVNKNVTRTFNSTSKYLFVGLLMKRKYPFELVKALEMSNEKDFSLSIIGEGAEKNTIESYLADKPNLSQRVHLLGRVSRDEVSRRMQDSDVFCMISKDETFGLVYLEAMAAGCITIASRDEGFDGIIVNGENGFLCEAGNTEELITIINHINEMSSTELLQMSQKAIETAKEMTDEKVAQTYINNLIKYM